MSLDEIKLLTRTTEAFICPTGELYYLAPGRNILDRNKDFERILTKGLKSINFLFTRK